MKTPVTRIRKGLDLPISGAAQRRIEEASVRLCAVKPTDYVGLVPKLLVAEGDKVSAGQALFCDKNDPRICFPSPVSGVVRQIVRGEKRALQAVEVAQMDDMPAPADIPHPASRDEMRAMMLRNGLWPLLRQRPFGTIPSPDTHPKALFVSCFDSAPLAPDYDYVMQGSEGDFAAGLEALSRLFDGPVHVSFRPGQRLADTMDIVSRNQRHFIAGPHPAGNIGTQMALFDPLDKGDTIWTIRPQDAAVIGRFLRTGEYRPEKVIAVVGPDARDPHYYRVPYGASLAGIISSQHHGKCRVISGNVLSGTQIAPDGFLCAYDDMVTLMPEGDFCDFMGWLMPGVRKFSFSRTFLSGFLPKQQFFPWRFDTNTHGDVRPLVFTGDFERVFPLDIYPLQLLKACIIGDVDLMVNLGIYEVEPEDFALCEFIDPSKTDIQPIIREALEKLRKEAV